MFSQLLGKYLVDKKVLTDVQLREVLSEQAQARVKLGTIAVAEKLLTEKQAEEINHLQTQMDKRFGDIAIEQGYLTGAQLKELLDKQGNAAMKFIQILTEKKYVDISELDKYLTAFGAEMGFTAEEMKALKNDDIEASVKYFVPDDAPEYVAGIAGLALRNIVRLLQAISIWIRHIRQMVLIIHILWDSIQSEIIKYISDLRQIRIHREYLNLLRDLPMMILLSLMMRPWMRYVSLPI